MNKLRTTPKTRNDQQAAEATAPLQETAHTAPEAPDSPSPRPTGLRNAQASEATMSLKSSLMAPQTPRVTVPLHISEDLKDFVLSDEKAPRTVSAARLSLGKAVFEFEGIQSPDKIAKVTLTIPGHEPFHFKRGFTKGGTPYEVVRHALDFLRNAKEKWSQTPQEAPEGVSMPPKEFFQDLVEAARENASGLGGFKNLFTVTRADEKMAFTFDRSRPETGHAVRLDGVYSGVTTGAMGIISARPDTRAEEGFLTFNTTPFMDDRGISCSGGPALDVKLADLVPTDQTVQRTFWRWRDGMSGGDRGEYYLLDVPVWSWKGSARSVFEKFDRQAFKALIANLDETHPDGRRDFAYLQCKRTGVEEHLYTTGSIHAPFTTGNGERHEFFEAQMGVGSNELVAFAAGRTWDECLQNLREDLLQAYDRIGSLPYTDPERVAHSGAARRAQESPNYFWDNRSHITKRVQRLVEAMVEQAGEREFLITTAPKDESPYSKVVTARTAREALRAAGYTVEDDTFHTLEGVDACEIAVEDSSITASAIEPLQRPSLGRR